MPKLWRYSKYIKSMLKWYQRCCCFWKHQGILLTYPNYLSERNAERNDRVLPFTVPNDNNKAQLQLEWGKWGNFKQNRNSPLPAAWSPCRRLKRLITAIPIGCELHCCIRAQVHKALPCRWWNYKRMLQMRYIDIPFADRITWPRGKDFEFLFCNQNFSDDCHRYS